MLGKEEQVWGYRACQFSSQSQFTGTWAGAVAGLTFLLGRPALWLSPAPFGVTLGVPCCGEANELEQPQVALHSCTQKHRLPGAPGCIAAP